MVERSDHLDFDIRDQGVRAPLTQPHRHEYFQIQINLGGDTNQHIGGAVRAFPERTLSFVLPYRVHLIPHPPRASFTLINFSQRFLRPDLDVDPLDLEDVSVSMAPELTPFRFQEYVDFTFDRESFTEITTLIDSMRRENAARRFGSLQLIRGKLLQLLAMTCQRWETELLRLASTEAQQTGRRDAMARVLRYVRDNLSREIGLNDAAAAAFLSPNYLAHLIKKETGQTFTDIVTERRLERARELLITGSARIGQVARQCGFADEAYFTRRFKQWYGSSPRQWRDSMRANIGAKT
ncbi:MAG: helix-turn-helix transcriptional regulator [Casimicrobium sp.]